MTYAERRIPLGALIDVDDDVDMGNWANWLGVPEAELARAIARVGPSAEVVRAYLREEE